MLDGKTILVTGAASGIGRAAARLFASYGARLLLVDRDAAGLTSVADALPGAMAAPADITDVTAVEAAVARAVDAFGRLDGAFNNAGIEGDDARPSPTADYPAAAFDAVIAVNVRGTWNCMAAEVRAMLAGGGGAIVNTASVLGHRAAPGMPAYVASKHATIGLTRVAALDYARAGVRVNAVLPGIVDTAMIGRAEKVVPGYSDYAAQRTPMGRMCRPEEIAEAAAWLLSDRASYVTGHTLVVDGGMSASA